MKSAKLGAWFVIAVAVAVLPQTVPSNDKPTDSKHRKGPHGLEGWTESEPVAEVYGGNEPLPFKLVIARNGKVVWRIDGDPFLWRWMFWADGQQMVYESGPLHFSMACVLFDLTKGREVERVDCFHDLPANAPAWAKALEGMGEASGAAQQ
jgi:hypothetical protein